MEKTEAKTFWSPAPDSLDLWPHQVDIWRVSLDLPAATVIPIESTLSADESQRAARFYFKTDRDRFVAAHGCLHDILARYLHDGPDLLKFSTGEHGKPVLVSTERIDFNLAHSGDFALIAVTCGHRVGVDLERTRQDLEFEDIARRYFSQREVSEFLAMPVEKREAAFFRCWTRKEAYIKAHGLGLSMPLDSFDVSLTSDELAILRTTRPDSSVAARWTLHSLDVDPLYASAVAVEDGAGLEIRLWDWNIS